MRITEKVLEALILAEQQQLSSCPTCRFDGTAGRRTRIQRAEFGYRPGMLLTKEGVAWLERLFEHADMGGPLAGPRPNAMYEPCVDCHGTGKGESSPLLLALTELRERRLEKESAPGTTERQSS